MKLLEFFTVTEPDMLLEAAKDRYKQMLPEETIMKFFVVVDTFPILAKELRREDNDPRALTAFWDREVTFAVNELKRADRITWYLRYIKVFILRWGLMIFVRQLNEAHAGWDARWVGDGSPEAEQVLKQLSQQWEKMERKVSAELKKLQQNTTKYTQEIAKEYEVAREQAHQAYKEAFAARQADDNRNTRSRLTNAEAAWQRTIKMNDAFISVGADESGEFVDSATQPQGSGAHFMHNNKNNLNHYMSIPDQRIQEFNWGFMFIYPMSNLFNIWENEWAAKQARTIPHEDPSWEGSEKIIEFSDGMAWWNLHRSYCEREGKAMGHCGNSYRRNRPVEVLTLRTPEEDGWKVNLTFIYNTQTGEIEESKGFNNQKPDAKYHPYILELLKQPWIRGFNQANSHEPENNFYIEDLEDEQQDEIKRLNPRLAGYIDEETWMNTHEDMVVTFPDGTGWAKEKPVEERYSDHNVYELGIPYETDVGMFWKPHLLIKALRGDGKVVWMGAIPMRKVTYEKDLRKIGEALLRIGDFRGFSTELFNNQKSNSPDDLPDEVREKIYNDRPAMLGAFSNEVITAMEDAGRLAHSFEDGSKAFESEEHTGTSIYVLKPISTPNDPNSKVHWIKDLGVRMTTSGEVKSMAAYDFFREKKQREPTDEDWSKIATVLMMPGISFILPENIMLHDSLTKEDIPEHIMQQIGEAKPSMVGFSHWAEKEGITNELLLGASTMASFKGLNHLHGLVRQAYVLHNYKDGWMAMYGSDLPAWYQSHMDRNYEEGSPYDIHRKMASANAHTGEIRWYENFVRTIHERPVIYDRRKTLDWIQARYQSAEEDPEGEAITFWVRIDKVLDAVDGPQGNYYVPQQALLKIEPANFHEGEEGWKEE